MYYEASIMEVVKSVVTGQFFLIPVVTAAILALFKVIPNDAIQNGVGKMARGLARALTLNMSKWKWTAPFWNKTIEPYLIDLLDNTLATFAREFIVGLRSDNE